MNSPVPFACPNRAVPAMAGAWAISPLPQLGAGGAGRRRCLQGLGAGAGLLALPPAWARELRTLLPDAGLWRRPRALWVSRPQSQETVRTVYWADGALVPEGYAALNRIYRDIHANVQWPIAPGLLDLNFLLQSVIGRLLRPSPLILFSGFRTAHTNAQVGGTEPNIHGLGLADDYRFAGLSLQDNHRLARRFQLGGLGLYPDRGSLHKDIGRYRSWITWGPSGVSPHEHASFR